MSINAPKWVTAAVSTAALFSAVPTEAKAQDFGNPIANAICEAARRVGSERALNICVDARGAVREYEGERGRIIADAQQYILRQSNGRTVGQPFVNAMTPRVSRITANCEFNPNEPRRIPPSGAALLYDVRPTFMATSDLERAINDTYQNFGVACHDLHAEGRELAGRLDALSGDLISSSRGD